MFLLIKNIKSLIQTDETKKRWVAGSEMKFIPSVENAFLLIENGLIKDYGDMLHCPEIHNYPIIYAHHRFVLPCWVDSHTHIVYATSREKEFVDRINGLSYQEIAQRGGGILNSAQKLQSTPEEELFESSKKRLEEIILYGTGAVEIKSGYGLTVKDEIKMLKVISWLKEISPIPIKATFLGAHAIPKEYSNRNDYINLIVNEMLPEAAKQKLADYIDVFCDKGFFTAEETDFILKAGKNFGLIPKIHANELDLSGGIQVGVANHALSVDHLEHTGDKEIQILKNSSTMPTLLPSTAFFLGMNYPPARKMIDAGLPVALATDYNPGSSPSGNMSFILSLACIKMKMLPEETINAATINGAYALNLENEMGTISKGKKANIIITAPIPSLAYLPYSFGTNLIDRVIINGKEFNGLTA